MENMLRIMVLIVIVATVASFPFHHLKKREVGHEEKRNTHSPVDIELMRYMITMVRDIFTYYNIPSDGGVTVHQLADYYRRAGANNEVATKLSRDSMILIHDRPTGFLTQAELLQAMVILRITDFL